MTDKKISDLVAGTPPYDSASLLELSVPNGSGGFVSRKAEIADVAGGGGGLSAPLFQSGSVIGADQGVSLTISGGTAADSAGPSYAYGGNTYVRAGHAGSGSYSYAGDSFIQGGDGANFGGRVNIRGGHAGSANGGSVRIEGGASDYGNGGIIILEPGTNANLAIDLNGGNIAINLNSGNIAITTLPTSPIGLPSGALYNTSGTVSITP